MTELKAPRAEKRPVATHIQVFAGQNDVQRLVPRHFVQAQRDIATHAIRRDDVQARELRKNLQHGAHIDLLERQRKFLSGEHTFATNFVVVANLEHVHAQGIAVLRG